MQRINVANLARYAALLAAMLISFTVERQLAVSHGVPVAVSPAVPVAVDLWLIYAVRSARDVAAAVLLAVAANVAGVLTAESLSAVDTWVSAGLHAVFPLAVWRMHRTPHVAAVGPLTAGAAIPATVAATGPQTAAGDFPSDDLWADFEDTAPDVTGQRDSDAPDMPGQVATTPPDVAAIREVVGALAADGRKVTGPMLADHFGVSARTGRRYLAMSAA
ncbi:transfer protein spdA [Streptomyces sp. NPDC054804]